MKIHNLAIIANVQLSGARGGAETFQEKLYEYFSKVVDHVEMINVPCDESSFEGILSCYQACYDLDLSRFDGVISSKAPTFAVSHPNHVCYLMHTVRVFYDMFDEIAMDPENVKRAKLIHRLDRELLSAPRTKELFSIGKEVSERIEKYIDVQGSVCIHPGMTSEGFWCGEQGDYIYAPGRVHRWKRVDLAVRAMKYVKSPVKLKIAGTGEQLQELQKLAKGLTNIEFLGRVTDEEMKQLYADALAVMFTPIREDYGYILHEAFKSEKPVLTCNDSGEPARFIAHGENGFVCNPNPREIAKCFDQFYFEREKTAQMGRAGKKSIEHITWENVVEVLLEALER